MYCRFLIVLLCSVSPDRPFYLFVIASIFGSDDRHWLLSWPVPSDLFKGYHIFFAYFHKHDRTGLSYLTQIRVGLSKLNFHAVTTTTLRMRNIFCCSALLSMPWRNPIAGVSALLRSLGYTNFSNKFLIQILFYGDTDFPDIPDSLNKDMLLLTFCFTHETGRFD